MTILPDRLLKLVPSDIRATLGRAGMTAEEAAQRCVAKSEAALQKQIEQMLCREGIYVIRQRCDRKSNVRIGTPDLLFAVNGVPCAWEIKLPTQKPRPEQVTAMEAMARNGWRVAVIHSYDEARVELAIAKGGARG